MVSTASDSADRSFVDNQRALHQLARAIAFSAGHFSLVLVRCNYLHLRDHVLQQLSEILRQEWSHLPPLQVLELSPDVTHLYRFVKGHLGDNSVPVSGVLVLGLESVIALEELLIATNVIRDEFRKQLFCPLVLWVNDAVLHKFLQLAPDLANFAANPISFDLTTEDLKTLIYQKADTLCETLLSQESKQLLAFPVSFLPHHHWVAWGGHRLELESALRTLEHRQVVFDPALEASLALLWGHDRLMQGNREEAIANYQKALDYWQNQPYPDRQGLLLFYRGLCLALLSEQDPEHHDLWQQSWQDFQAAMHLWEKCRRQDLIAQMTGQVSNVLQHLADGETLEKLTQQFCQLHQKYGLGVQLALDYGFLGKLALERGQWEKAKEQLEQCLNILESGVMAQGEEVQVHYPLLWAQLFQLLLVKCQRQLHQQQEALWGLEHAQSSLHRAITESNSRHDPHQYLRLLAGVRSLYFQERCYREAFLLKQERRSVQSQYGLRPFVGAAQLRPSQQPLNPLLATIIPHKGVAPAGAVAEAISTSHRQQDVQQLIYRLSRSDYRITVIHGPSGVGKSSTVTAGLVPTLQAKTLGDQIPVPVVMRVYRDWVTTLGQALIQGIKAVQNPEFQLSELSLNAYLQHFHHTADQNLLTILIFDQFEEFFFVCTDPKDRREFYQFLHHCLHLPGIKFIFSIREDYLHHLLEIERTINLENIGCNFLDKANRYPLGNFSKEHTFEVIKNITKNTQFELDHNLILALVEDLSGGTNEVRPIELQIVGSQLQDKQITTLEKYQEFGPYPKQKLVEKFLESVIADCGEENDRQARQIIYTFTDEDGNRPLKTKSEIFAEVGSDLSSNVLNLVLDIFCEAGLIYVIPEEPESRYQLVHDYLVVFIQEQEKQSINEERSQLQQQNADNQKTIDKLKHDNDVISQLAEQRYQFVQQDLEIYIPTSKSAKKLSDLEALDQEKQILSQRQYTIEKLRQEQQLLTELALAKQKHKRSETQRKTILDSLLISASCTILMLVSFAWNGVINQIKTLGTSSEALMELNKELEGLTTGLRAAKQIKNTPFVPPKVVESIEKTLSYALYKISEENRLEGHKDGVYSVTFSADSQWIATAGEDRMIRLWNSQGKHQFTIPGHQDIITSLSFSADSQWLASGSWDNTIKLWDFRRLSANHQIAGGDPIEYRELKGHTDQIISLTFNQDSVHPLIASASRDQTVKIWRIDGSEVATLRHESSVLSASFSPDGQLVATASFDGKIRLWRIDGTLVKVFFTEQEVYSLAWSPGGEFLAAAGQVIQPETGERKGTVIFWTMAGAVRELEAHEDTVLDIKFSQNGLQFATASKDKTIKVWSLLDWSLQKILTGHEHWVPKVSFSPDGSRLASASLDKTVKLWRLNESFHPASVKREVWQGFGGMNGVSVSPNGKAIATIGDQGMIELWQADGTLLRQWQGHQGQVWGVTFSPDSQQVVTGGDDRTVKVWNLQGKLLYTLKDHEDVVLSVSFSPDGKLIASGSKDNTVKLWHNNGKLYKTLSDSRAAINWVSFSPDGELIASASDEGRVKLWSREGTQVGVLQHRGAVWGVAFSPDGQAIATASYDSRVKLWNRQGKLLTEPLEHDGDTVASVTFSPDGEILASASHNIIRLWRKDGTLLHILTGNSHRPITGMSFSADGKTLFSVSRDGLITLWDLDQLQLNELLNGGCEWLQGYLQYNPTGQQQGRSLCDSPY